MKTTIGVIRMFYWMIIISKILLNIQILMLWFEMRHLYCAYYGTTVHPKHFIIMSGIVIFPHLLLFMFGTSNCPLCLNLKLVNINYLFIELWFKKQHHTCNHAVVLNIICYSDIPHNSTLDSVGLTPCHR